MNSNQIIIKIFYFNKYNLFIIFNILNIDINESRKLNFISKK